MVFGTRKFLQKKFQKFLPHILLKVSGELGFPLLDLRVDYHDSSVDELIRIYRHSQSEWAQEWRDSMNDLPEMNMKREFRVA